MPNTVLNHIVCGCYCCCFHVLPASSRSSTTAWWIRQLSVSSQCAASSWLSHSGRSLERWLLQICTCSWLLCSGSRLMVQWTSFIRPTTCVSQRYCIHNLDLVKILDLDFTCRTSYWQSVSLLHCYRDLTSHIHTTAHTQVSWVPLLVGWVFAHTSQSCGSGSFGRCSG